MPEVGRQLVHFARSIMSGAIPTYDRPDGKGVGPKIVDARWPSGHGLGPCTPACRCSDRHEQSLPAPSNIRVVRLCNSRRAVPSVSFKQSIPFGTVVLQSHRDIRIDWKDSFPCHSCRSLCGATACPASKSAVSSAKASATRMPRDSDQTIEHRTGQPAQGP